MPNDLTAPKTPLHPRLAESAQRIEALRAAATADPEAFWKREATDRIAWMRPPTKIKNTSFDRRCLDQMVRGRHAECQSFNCIDRHLATRGDQIAIIWEGDDPARPRAVTYRELHEQVCRFANVLKAHGVKKGDRVTIYMPMIPEAAYAMLACARIGAVAFGGVRRLLAGQPGRPHRGLRSRRS